MTVTDTAPSPVAAVKTQVVPTVGAIHCLAPLTMDEVTFTSGFWADRQTTNASGTIPHCLAWEERIGWIENFERARAGTIAGHHAGLWFADSDVYKLIEAMAWEVGRVGGNRQGRALETEIQRLGAIIEAAQDDDGYINTRYGKPGVEDRYTNFPMGHELYCTGHLIQAAIARLRCGRNADDVIVRTALRNADHVCATFGVGGVEAVGGHPEIEVALVELYRATGERRYLDQAQIFLDRRGHGLLGDFELGREYFQDDTPVREEVVARGHAVRALYLMAGAIDAAMERGDRDLLGIVRAQYDRTLARRTYLTGGMGSRHEGESFGDDYELPTDRCYCETCAGIASVMVAWRLLLATGDVHYADVIERTLYNVVAASPAADGRSFFYANPLQVRVHGKEVAAGKPSLRSGTSLRAPWFEVSCCPTNIARTLASLAGASVTRSVGADVAVPEIQVHHLTSMNVSTTVTAKCCGDQCDGAAAALAFHLRTDYPTDGRIVLVIDEAPAFPVRLAVRIPSWASGAARLDGAVVESATGSGYAVVEGVLVAGEEHILELPMAPRVTHPHPRIDAVRGQIAIERGPLVLCAESVDLPEGLTTEDIEVAPNAGPILDAAGRVTIEARPAMTANDWPYDYNFASGSGSTFALPLVPYYSWGNRGPATMRVWLPQSIS
ncbi:MAG: glycoside hydrolase family 127 protein [Actinomyces succiniciruminis]|nr:glycoside hydrolase family 127 protein [Actinomyces succiniciruminis]